MEKTPFRKASQENSKKEKLVKIENTDSLIIKAALEFGADYLYRIENGTMGPTLYIQASNKQKASCARKKAPCFWNKLYVVVLYNTEAFSGSVHN